MNRIPLIIITCLLLILIAFVAAYAQTEQVTALGESSASLTIVETIPVSASVEISINGQIYKLDIPVTVNIDAQKDLAEALLNAPSVDRIGDVKWVITNIAEYEEEFDLSSFTTLEPISPDNKLVVISSDITNMGTEPFEYFMSVSDLYAYDLLGNLFEPTDRECDDINPGATLSCTIVFDVPDTVTLHGLDMKVTEHKRIPLTTSQ